MEALREPAPVFGDAGDLVAGVEDPWPRPSRVVAAAGGRAVGVGEDA